MSLKQVSDMRGDLVGVYSADDRQQSIAHEMVSGMAAMRSCLAASQDTTPIMTVSVAILTHNRESLVLQAIQSAKEQRYPAYVHVEIIVLDNGSTDATFERITLMFPDVTLLRSTRNLGCPGGRNVLYANCKGSIIINLDDDGRLGPDLIRGAVDLFESDDRIGIVAFRWEETIPARQDDLLLRIEDASSFSGGVSAFRKAMLDSTGDYPEKYFYMSEEEHLALRAMDHNYRIVYASHLVMLHPKSCESKGRKWDYHRTRNEMTNVIELFPFPYSILFLIYRALANLYRSSRRFTIFQYLRAMASILQASQLTKRNPVSRETMRKYISYRTRTSRKLKLLAALLY